MRRALLPLWCIALAACGFLPAQGPPAAPLALEQEQPAEEQPEPYPGFLDDLRALVRELPLGASVQVEVLDLSAEGVWGRTGWDEGAQMWRIQLSSCACWPVLRDTLAHEWAHALTGDAGGPTELDHGPMWGVAYAAAYRVLEAEFLARE